MEEDVEKRTEEIESCGQEGRFSTPFSQVHKKSPRSSGLGVGEAMIG